MLASTLVIVSIVYQLFQWSLHAIQVADGLHFLHTQANQIHRGISPEAICITAAGAWKLAGFGFAMLADFGNTNPAEAAFDYGDSSASLAAQSLKVHPHAALSCAWCLFVGHFTVAADWQLY